MSGDFIQKDVIKKKLTYGAFLKRVFPYFVQEKSLGIFVFSLIIVSLFVGRAIPLLIGYIVDLLRSKDLQAVYTMGFIFLGVRLLDSFFEYFINFKVNQFGNRVLYNIREKVMVHLQALPISYFDRTPVGRTVTRITNDVLSLGVVLTQGLTGVILNLFEVIAVLVTLTALSPTLTGITLVFVPFATWVTLSISLKLRHVFQESKKKMAAINTYTAETFNGIKVVQLYNLESVRRKFLKNLSKEKLNLDLESVKYFAQLWPLMSFFNYFTISMALFFGAYYYDEFGFTVGKISSYLFLLQSLFPPLRNLLERFNQYQDALAGADRVFQLLDEKEEKGLDLPFSDAKLRGAIEFRNLFFRYSPHTKYVLKDINLKIRPGESVALVGRTGSGKTTITSLIQRYYDYEEGEILIDDKPLREYSPLTVRSRVGIVMQDNFIFRGTIKSNVTLADEKMDESVVRKAVRQAHCHQIIESRPEGLNAQVEERGANLSAGEKQLISFARALAHNPDILILDEATANIDSNSEKLIQQSIEEITANRTSLIIAHRLSTILHCDRIVLLENGRIIEQGSHSELIQQKGAYWDLYQSQFQH
ncbi:MAG: ABC transporter ATP-binding protein [Bdellovibrionales bacterium]|nr:ABC transporter ATP-binding protein [Bdellovibrionales bacterium]